MDEWIQLVLSPILKGLMPDKSDLNRLGGLALFSADTDRIKAYVFESTKLPEIRGASMILDELNQGWLDATDKSIRHIFKQHGLPIGRRDDESDSCIIYAGGGSLLAVVPQNLAEKLKSEIEVLFPNETDVATITCVYQEVIEPSLLKDEFQHLMATQALLLRQRKENREIVPFFETLPHQQRCTSCGARPASSRSPREFSSDLLCLACLKKVEHSTQRRGKKRWMKEFEGYIQEHLPEDQLRRYMGSISLQDRIEGAEDVEEIARAGHNQNTIGFIYADGDGVGSFIESSGQIREYREKSQKLKALRDIVYAALAHYLQVGWVERKDKGQVYIHPFEIVTIGGDDLLLIVPGDVALPIAIEICQTFSKKFKDKIEDWTAKGWNPPKRPLTMSAGVVIAHHHNPIRYVRDLAEQLLKSAKKRARQSPPESAEGAIDFLTLKSQSMLWAELRTLRGNAYEFTGAGGKEHISLIGRPYLVSEMDRLLIHARLLRDEKFPRSQIQGIRQALRKAERFGWMWPILWYLRQQIRLRPLRLRRLTHYLDMTWAPFDPTQDALPPWRYVKTKKGIRYYTTVWEDLHEVIDLLPRPEHEPSDVLKLSQTKLKEILGIDKEEEVTIDAG